MNISSTSANFNFIVASSTGNGGAWLKVTPAGSCGLCGMPNVTAVTITADPALAAGTYTGQIVFTAQSGAQSMTIPVTLIVRLGTSTPIATSVSPNSGSGASQIFTFTFSDTSGWQSLKVMNFMIQGNFLDGRAACYVALLPASNAVLLVDDAGDGGGPFGILVLPTSGSVHNSQCTINGTGSSMSAGGNNITVALSITFSGTFTGNKVIYMAAGDSLGTNTGWQPIGTWNVPGPPTTPSAVGGVSPSQSTTASQVFTFTFTDTNGVSDFGVEDVLINAALDGRHACYVAFTPASNAVLLVDDAGDAGGPFGVLVLPTASTISNSQCTINGTGSSVAKVGTTLTLTLSITFKPVFSGNRLIFMAASSLLPQNTGWQSVGSLTVP